MRPLVYSVGLWAWDGAHCMHIASSRLAFHRTRRVKPHLRPCPTPADENQRIGGLPFPRAAPLSAPSRSFSFSHHFRCPPRPWPRRPATWPGGCVLLPLLQGQPRHPSHRQQRRGRTCHGNRRLAQYRGRRACDISLVGSSPSATAMPACVVGTRQARHSSRASGNTARLQRASLQGLAGRGRGRYRGMSFPACFKF
jgi:hypothetical protein